MECRKIVRRGSLKRKVFTGARMGEGKAVGVEKLALDPGGAGEGARSPVQGVAGHGAAGGGSVDADLVGAAGEKFQLQQGGAGPGAHDFPVGAGRPSLGSHRHFLPVNGVAADRTLPGTDLSLRPAENKREIGLLGLAVLELAAEFAVGRLGFGGHENAGRFQVQAVNDAGPVRAAAGGELARAVVEQGGGEGSGGSTGTRMDGQAGRFVEHDDIGILVQDIERNGFRFDMPGLGGGNPDRHGGTGGKKITGLDGLAVAFD